MRELTVTSKIVLYIQHVFFFESQIIKSVLLRVNWWNEGKAEAEKR